MQPIITLLSDFGSKDAYVAEMKAVVLSICPEARIVDISHEIRKFDVRMGAFVLASATPYFPKGTIHVVVVDPGVGTKRRGIVVETQQSFYLGPDNGVLMLAAQKEDILHVYHLTNKKYMLPNVSHTFHGRDVFAPMAAHLARGCKPSDFGRQIHDYVVPKFSKPSVKRNEVFGEVIHIDDFGNVITNVRAEDLEKAGIPKTAKLQASLMGKTLVLKFCSTYGDVPEKTPLALIGSHGFLELSVNQGNASEFFNITIGNTIHLSLVRPVKKECFSKLES